jgi:hypothetical protein
MTFCKRTFCGCTFRIRTSNTPDEKGKVQVEFLLELAGECGEGKDREDSCQCHLCYSPFSNMEPFCAELQLSPYF